MDNSNLKIAFCNYCKQQFFFDTHLDIIEGYLQCPACGKTDEIKNMMLDNMDGTPYDYNT